MPLENAAPKQIRIEDLVSILNQTLREYDYGSIESITIRVNSSSKVSYSH